MFGLWLLSVFLVFRWASSQNVGPVVETPLGRVVGWERLSRDGRLYEAFTRLPYAQPPVGNLRFKAPLPPRKWNGTLMATGDTPMCLQKMGRSVGSEDCLYLNVYRPKNCGRNLPVLFRVHGGAFQIGYLGTRENADYLMDEDVVLVQIHYRLGGFGFMGLNDKMMPGNFGIRDQIMALKWVKQNIASFGGNPNSVTVLGESAGGASTHILLKTPAAEGLVHRALSDSGTANNIWSQLRPGRVREGTLNVAQKLGCPVKLGNKAIFECLQRAKGEDIMNALPPGMSAIDYFAPCYDPPGTPDPVIPVDLSLIPSRKPWITSNCNGEFTLSLTQLKPADIEMASKNIEGYLQKRIYKYTANPSPGNVRLGVAILKNAYFSQKKPMQDLVVDIAKLEANTTFFFTALHDLMTHQGPKWYYILEYVGEIARLTNKFNVAGHAEPAAYYFNTRSSYPSLSPKETPEDYQVSKRLIKYLVNFAYHNDPTPPGTPFKWEQFSKQMILRITNSQYDIPADQKYKQQLMDVLNIYTKVFGWGPHI